MNIVLPKAIKNQTNNYSERCARDTRIKSSPRANPRNARRDLFLGGGGGAKLLFVSLNNLSPCTGSEQRNAPCPEMRPGSICCCCCCCCRFARRREFHFRRGSPDSHKLEPTTDASPRWSNIARTPENRPSVMPATSSRVARQTYATRPPCRCQWGGQSRQSPGGLQSAGAVEFQAKKSLK